MKVHVNVDVKVSAPHSSRRMGSQGKYSLNPLFGTQIYCLQRRHQLQIGQLPLSREHLLPFHFQLALVIPLFSGIS